MITFHLTEHPETLKKRAEALKYLASHRVDVGLPSSAPERSRFILAIQEHGSPVMRIPPRPVIGPALAQAETREAMAAAMMEALSAAQAGDLDATKAGLEACGQAGADGIRAYIDAGISPGNAPVTIHGGWIWNRVAKTGVRVKGKGFDKPLYDTGELYRSFSYEITGK